MKISQTLLRYPLAVFWLLVTSSALLGNDAAHVLWFDEPAESFTETLPLGNGRLGAAVYGKTDEETIVLNETGMWSGSPQDANRPDAAEALPRIRRLLFAGEHLAAQRLMNERFTCQGAGSGRGRGANLPYGCYQTLGKLHVRFFNQARVAPADYRRELDLRTAVATVKTTRDDLHSIQQVFASYPDQVVVYRLHADRRASLNFDVRLTRPERADTTVHGQRELQMTGQLDDGAGGNQGVRYAVVVRVARSDGTTHATGDSLQVRDASDVVLLIGAATDLQRFTRDAALDPLAAARRAVRLAADKTFAELIAGHLEDYQAFYNRVELDLQGERPSSPVPPTPERLRANAAGRHDASLAVLAFNFGRHLLIAASRPGGRPANLQGLWAESIQTPWNGDWHLNVNVQMNYWPAEVCQLSELHEPLFALTEALAAPGAHTARAYYNAPGWVAHVLANPWGFTAPGEEVQWGATNTCSAWLCQHLWDHYLFTQDRRFLQRIYPLLRDASRFYLDVLVEHPRYGWLVTAPSTSPENLFAARHGEAASICVGSTMDMQVLRYLFAACEEAADLLGQDALLRNKLADARRRLPPTRIGADGRIMEWLEEHEEIDPQHRHVAHLWGLYPGDEIHPDKTPRLAAAARATLERRGDSGPGWSLGMKMAMWARLQDAERAHLLLSNYLRPVTQTSSKARRQGGTYPNLWSAHPPFQIDGNFGVTAAIVEMLLQSNWPLIDGRRQPEIILLPALPTAWPDGRVAGLQARGGLDASLTWRGGQLVEARLKGRHATRLRVRYGDLVRELAVEPDSTVVLDGQLQMRQSNARP